MRIWCVKLTTPPNESTHQFGRELLPPNVSNFPNYVYIFLLFFVIFELIVCWCAIFTLRRKICCLGLGANQIEMIMMELNLHKKIITEKETGKLNSLRRKWFIVLKTEHVLCSRAKSIHNFLSRLTLDIVLLSRSKHEKSFEGMMWWSW